MAKSSPDRLIRQTRVAVAPSIRSGEGVTGVVEAPLRSLSLAVSMSRESGIGLTHGPFHGGKQIFRLEGLDHILAGPLLLPPEFVALLAF